MIINNLIAQSSTLGEPIDAVIATQGCGGVKINTAIGCIPIGDTVQLASKSAQFAIGIAGAITLIIIAFNAFRVMTSSGDPKSLQAAKDGIFSAISALLMIIFSGFILRLIGVDILGLF